MSVKKQLLDPLGTICKLIILNFSQINTKISIHNHILTIDKPCNYQFLLRMINGDGKENISEMFYAVIRVLKWYLNTDTNLDDQDNSNRVQIMKSQEITRIIKYVCCALRKLQETYEYGNVILAIQFYINILEDSIKHIFDEAKLPKYVIEKEKEFENLLDYDKLRNFWDYKKLKTICELYDKCFTIHNDMEMPLCEKDALITGFLNTIQTILELTDNEFQKLIQNSNRG